MYALWSAYAQHMSIQFIVTSASVAWLVWSVGEDLLVTSSYTAVDFVPSPSSSYTARCWDNTGSRHFAGGPHQWSCGQYLARLGAGPPGPPPNQCYEMQWSVGQLVCLSRQWRWVKTTNSVPAATILLADWRQPETGQCEMAEIFLAMSPVEVTSNSKLKLICIRCRVLWQDEFFVQECHRWSMQCTIALLREL